MSAGPHRRRRPAYHFREELLLDYATGSLPEGETLLVATHLALCHACRAAAVDLEAIGGALLSAVEPRAEGRLPQPLHAYLGGDSAEILETLTWLTVVQGVEQALLRPQRAGADADWPPGVQVSLVRLAPGAAAPQHTHLGIEATVIVQGGFADGFGHYERGDAWIVDGSVDHLPVALRDEPCLCLVYQDAPLKLTGP